MTASRTETKPPANAITVYVPGFPSEVSDPIELPDIGELLMYPPFGQIEAEHFLKHAVDFQRYLFNRIPLRNDKKVVIVRSGVWLLQPGTRSHVNRYGDWHFDGSIADAHRVPEQRTYIIQSACSALTEFNANPMQIESTLDESRVGLANRIVKDPTKFGVIGKAIEPCRIYTFENHLHRAVDPKRIEFRFFFRVYETDVHSCGSLTQGPLDKLVLRDAATGQDALHIEYTKRTVSIYYSHNLDAFKPRFDEAA